jgi:hypothetical protein
MVGYVDYWIFGSAHDLRGFAHQSIHPTIHLRCARCELVEETSQGFFDLRFTICDLRFESIVNPANRKSKIVNPKSECVFCKRQVPTRGHHVVPRCKGGTEIVPACHSCEDFIHKTWSHNELRDTFNSAETILAAAHFQKFLKWLHRQQETAVFRSQRNRTRRRGKYR